MASCSELPTQPRTPRNAHDRGRYPEEAGHEEDTQHEPESDDEDEGEDPTFTFVPRGSEPININKPFTPSGSVAGSIAGSINGDDISICGSPGTVAMDIDIVRLNNAFYIRNLAEFCVSANGVPVVHQYQPVAVYSTSDEQCRAFKQTEM